MSALQTVQINRSQSLVLLFLIVLGGIIVWTESWLPFLLPVALLFFAWAILDIRNLFYLLFATLPFSIEYYFEPAGIGSDLPSEPIMLFFTCMTVIYAARNSFRLSSKFVTDGLTIVLFLHIVWILATTITAQNPLTSLKYFMAKIWYVVPFFLFPVFYFREIKDFTKVYKILIAFLTVSISIVLFRHSLEGFTFASNYDVVRPFFRNHVSYAAISVTCLPFVWAFYMTSEKGSRRKRLLLLTLLIFITGIYFSFTRAAILSMVFAYIAYYIITKRWVKHALFISLTSASILVTYLAIDNKYLDLTPNFERTITHTEFDNLLEATYKLEDISSMERVYRWMAGIEMIKDKPLFGFGPANFYDNYKKYSISQFVTYVSDNPEKSGIHNYFLMIFVEQGFPGFILFLLLCVLILLNAESVYHRYINHPQRYWVMAIGLSFIIILSMSLINDLIETDKVGPLFFLNIAALLFFKYKTEEEEVGEQNNSQ